MEAAASQRERSDRCERFQLFRRIGPKIHLGGLDAAVAEPESNLPDVVCCLEHPHRTAVPQGVR